MMNMAICAWLGLLAGIQVSLAAWLALWNVPKSSPLAAVVLPEWQPLLRPEWEAEIYHVFIFAVCAVTAVWIWVFRDRLDEALWPRLKARVAAETVWTALMLSAGFKMAVYPDRQDLARQALIILCAGAILLKVAFPVIAARLRTAWVYTAGLPGAHRRSLILRGGVLLIIALIAIPGPEAVVARFFVGEQFHHNDSFIMGPAWAYLSGNVLDVDTISQYGVGFAAVIGRLAQLLPGGFSYVNVLNVLVAGTVLYYLVWFIMLGRMYRSAGMALAAVLLGVKWQMFHEGVFPFVFTYGSTTVWRGIMDVFMFAAVFAHLRHGGARWVIMAAAAAGFGVYYLPSEGIYLSAAFYTYLVCHGLNDRFQFIRFQSGLSSWGKWVAAAVTPVLVCSGALWLTVGQHLWEPEFWRRTGEFIQYFLSGFGAQPIFANLTDRQFERELFGFCVPAVYVMTVLVVAGLAWMRRADKHAFWLVAMAVYGLSTYHYYVVRSTSVSYCAVILPCVWIAGYWVTAWLRDRGSRALPYKAVLLATAFWALVTNHLFMAYPNILNLSRNPMVDRRVALPAAGNKPYFDHLFRDAPESAAKVATNSLGTADEGLVQENDFANDKALVAYYRGESDFSQDAALIQSLTGPGDKVPLMSSFEVSMLMQANRRPYFYYFPLVISRPMGMRLFPAISIYSTEQLSRTLEALEKDKPPYMFLERMLLAPEVPQYYLFRFPTTIALLQYIRAHYVPFKEGRYLTACKRIS